MTDDINNYAFTFKKEARYLARSLGPNGNDVYFVETDAAQQEDSNGDTPKVNPGRIIGKRRLFKSFKNISAAREAVISTYSKVSGALSSGDIPFDLKTKKADGHIISMLKDEYSTGIFGEEKKPLMRLFTLYHETAHALIPGPEPDNEHPLSESAADAYAALLFFQRFGNDAGDFLSMVSWSRAFYAISGKTSHLTTTVLDKIIADSAHEDFSKLTPAETIERATAYAKEWTPEASVISAARPFFVQDKGINIALLAKTCLASPSNDFAFYIGAKLFQPFLQPEGVEFNGKAMQLTDGARQQFTDLIEKHAAHTSLSEIFNATAKPEAEPPLTTLLKVSCPKNKKPFAVNL